MIGGGGSWVSAVFRVLFMLLRHGQGMTRLMTRCIQSMKIKHSDHLFPAVDNGGSRGRNCRSFVSAGECVVPERLFCAILYYVLYCMTSTRCTIDPIAVHLDGAGDKRCTFGALYGRGLLASIVVRSNVRTTLVSDDCFFDRERRLNIGMRPVGARIVDKAVGLNKVMCHVARLNGKGVPVKPIACRKRVLVLTGCRGSAPVAVPVRQLGRSCS